MHIKQWLLTSIKILNIKHLIVLIGSIFSSSGPEQWTRHLSLGECADESVVQKIMNSELGRPLSRLGRQTPRTRLSQPNLSIGECFPKLIGF